MIILKWCPRCGGAMVLDKDAYGSFLDCLQCGHLVDQDVSRLSVPPLQPVHER